MNFEDLQKTWQSQNPGARVTINADLLLNEVRRNEQQFRAMIFRRDVRKDLESRREELQTLLASLK